MTRYISQEKRKALLERMQQEKGVFEKGWIKKKSSEHELAHWLGCSQSSVNSILKNNALKNRTIPYYSKESEALRIRLDDFVKKNPGMFDQKVIERVKSFIEGVGQTPKKTIHFDRFLKHFDDWALLKTISLTRSDNYFAKSMYHNLTGWITRETKDAYQIKMARRMILGAKRIWTDYNFDEWVKFFDDHPKLKTMSVSGMMKDKVAKRDYENLANWITRETNDHYQIKITKQMIIGRKLNTSSIKNKGQKCPAAYGFDDWVKFFESHPELKTMNSTKMKKDPYGKKVYWNLKNWIRRGTEHVKNPAERQYERKIIKQMIIGRKLQNCGKQYLEKAVEKSDYEQNGTRPHNPSDPELAKLKKELYRLDQVLSELNPIKKKSHANGFLFGFGKCFEHYVGMLLSLNDKKVEHQYKVKTEGSFRIVDFLSENRQYSTMEGLSDFVEVKSGITLNRHDKGQLEDILEKHEGMTYVVHDKESELVGALRNIAEGKGKPIKVIGYYDLVAYPKIKDHELSKLFSDKEEFKRYNATISSERRNQFEADLFSAYLWMRSDNFKEDGLNEVLSAVYSQNNASKEKASKEHGMNWLSVKQYYDESVKIFSPGEGRHFDPELAKKKLHAKILRKEAEIAHEMHDQNTEKKEHHYLREKSFMGLKTRIEKEIPAGAMRWDTPPVRIYGWMNGNGHNKNGKSSDYLIEIGENGDSERFAVQRCFSREYSIRQWLKDGKISPMPDKYYYKRLKGAEQA